MNNPNLVISICSVLNNAGQLSLNRRKQLVAKGHPVGLIDQAAAVAQQAILDERSGPPARSA